PFYNPDIRTYDFDPEVAKGMLDTLGFVDSNDDGIREDINGTKLSFDLLVSSEFDRSVVGAQMMSEWMADIGIEVNVVPALFDVIWDQIGGSGLGTYDYDWSYIGWTLFWSDRHPNWVYWLFGADDSYWGTTINLPGWEGAQRDLVGQLAGDILFETDDTIIKDKLDEVQEIVAEELPYLPIDIQGGVTLYRTDKFEGWQLGNVTGPNNFWSFLSLSLIDSDGTSDGLTTITTTIDGIVTTITAESTGGDSPGFALITAVATTMVVAVVLRKRRT
ncbi:MAG: hypothetical protein IH840_08135, partial [Candidatus Heimdallarchaeota archaeon]|nr:hypothetical protein [Candidatus Heimdallarchaeota archaeon]